MRYTIRYHDPSPQQLVLLKILLGSNPKLLKIPKTGIPKFCCYRWEYSNPQKAINHMKDLAIRGFKRQALSVIDEKIKPIDLPRMI